VRKSPAERKYDKLLTRLAGLPSLLVAFSGGADSTFLLAAAKKAVSGRLLAVTVRSPAFPTRDAEHADATARLLEVEHKFMNSRMVENESFRANPTDRCYYCKYTIGTELLRLARKEGLAAVAEGTTADELLGHRPGAMAVQELELLSPLAEMGLTKEEVRELARREDVPNFDRPPGTCLATRFPYGSEITEGKLRDVEAVEQTIYDLGFRDVRCRHHGEFARIELDPKEIPRSTIASIRKRIASKIHELGFKFATLDLDGYRTGSMGDDTEKKGR
jgi:uncharacterized protein